MNEHVDADAELTTMQQLAAAMKNLDGAPEEQTNRVVRWFVDRYARSTSAPKATPIVMPGESPAENNPVPQFAALGDLYHAVDPKTDADRALVVGYWFQYLEGQPDFTAFTINRALRELGYEVGNITNALGTLGARHPKLAIQLKKAGTSKQARKTYKLTAAGKTAVESMISNP